MAKQQRIDPRIIERTKAKADAARRAQQAKNRGKSGRPGGRPAEQVPPATFGTWIAGARPQTLALAVAPVALGTGAASLLTVNWYDHWVRALLALAAAWFYTGGPKPYGYSGFGEIVVFLFFGAVPVAGTMFTQVGTVNVEAWVGGAALGAIAAAVLVVNNLRDRERDAAVGKRTLAVLLGNLGTRIFYIVLMVLPFGALAFYVIFYDYAVFVFFIGLAALPAMLIVATAKTPREYVTALQLTLLTAFGFGVGMAAVLAFGGILWI